MGRKNNRRSWQEFAFSNVVDERNGKRAERRHVRMVGKMMCMLTVDEHNGKPHGSSGDFCAWDRTWHASVSFVLGKDKRYGLPVSPSLDAWDEAKWKEAICMCHVMLKGVGEGQGEWVGDPSCLHFRKGLSDAELEEAGRARGVAW